MSENYIKCSRCGEMVLVPAELYPDPVEGEIPLSEPYYCDYCDPEGEREDPDPGSDEEPETCSHCGKDFEDFSTLGCKYCDLRVRGDLGLDIEPGIFFSREEE